MWCGAGRLRNRKLEAVVFLMSLEELFGGFLRNFGKKGKFMDLECGIILG